MKTPEAAVRVWLRESDRAFVVFLRAFFYQTDKYLRPNESQALFSMRSFAKLVPLFSIIVGIGSIILALERVNSWCVSGILQRIETFRRKFVTNAALTRGLLFVVEDRERRCSTPSPGNNVIDTPSTHEANLEHGRCEIEHRRRKRTFFFPRRMLYLLGHRAESNKVVPGKSPDDL